jgi:hypothetical protein
MLATSGVVDGAGVSGLLGHDVDSFLDWIWKITGGNADVCENTGVAEKAIRKLLKTKSGICHGDTEAPRTEWCKEMGMRWRSWAGDSTFCPC